MKTRNLRWLRRATAGLAAMAVGSSLLVCATVTVASATARPSVAQALRLSTAEQRQLLRLYAAYRHIPVSDIARIRSGTVPVARASNGEEWALEGFVASRSAPLSVSVGFQDGGAFGVFTRLPGRNWRLSGFGRPELGCDASIPAAVRRSWGFDSCPAAASGAAGVRSSHTAEPDTSSVGSEIQTIADNQANEGIADNPPETSFSGLDCNPYTTFENPAAGDSGCGTDPTFNVQDYSEFWCADFAKWVWSEAGVTGPLSDLTPGADSFAAYGLAEGESIALDPPASDAQVGDAIVLYSSSTTLDDIENGDEADHVGIVTGVDGDEIDTVNGDFIWGSSDYIRVADTGFNTPAYFASQAEGAGEQWIFVAPAGASTPALPDTYLAEMTDNDGLLYGYQDGTNKPTTLGMDPYSSPSTIGLSDDSTYVTAFEANDDDLYLRYSTGTNTSTTLGMAPGTSPAIAALSSDDEWEVAYQDNDGDLYLRSSAGVNDNTELGMEAYTSPAIAGSGGGWIVAYEDNDDLLYIVTSAGVKYQTTLGMEPQTDPAITVLANGGFVVAFQANTTDLYTYSVSGTSLSDIENGTKHGTPYGMEAYSSPSIASYTDSTWKVAFQTNDTDLYTYSSNGSDDTSTMAMEPYTSPAITCEPDGSYEIAFQANNGDLDIFHTGGNNFATNLGMELNDNSPTISALYNP